MESFLHNLLATLARGVIRRQRPFLVGVTGSVGKTSTKRAIAAVLSHKGVVRFSPRNYNNEIGLPVSVIGGDAPGRSLMRWLSVLFRGLTLGILRDAAYPDLLVLEYGADHPGDIAHLTSIAAPDIAVVTAVAPAHIAYFATIDAVALEKAQLVRSLRSQGIAMLNGDDDRVRAMAPLAPRAEMFGKGENAHVRITRVEFASEQRVVVGATYTLRQGDTEETILLRSCLGMGHGYAAAAAVLVGVSRGMLFRDAVHTLAEYVPPPSRMRVIPGVKGTTIIDDTYNSSPEAALLALDAIDGIHVDGQKIVVLGDMLELGEQEGSAHEAVGTAVAQSSANYLIVVGAASRLTAQAAQSAGMPSERIHVFATSVEAGRYVQSLIRAGDCILVKGSQGVRMERIVVEVMAEPLRAQELVCRQDASWLAR
jgi:UDP-N-acetylmuramoyl-tripeptide--D-alanyl-D-alanine ligase